jgi:hypothetical protein
MTNPVQECGRCGQPFWAINPDGVPLSRCPACAEKLESEPVETDDGPPRFVSLSALPPEKRVPPRHDGCRPGLFIPRRLEEMSGGSAAPLAKTLSPAPPPPLPPALPMPEFPRLGFNCPSCFTVLFVKDPAQYDGRAAPCPYCRVAIMPPRLAPPSPFILIADGPQSDLLPVPRASRWKPFKQNDFSSDAQQTVPTAPADVPVTSG